MTYKTPSGDEVTGSSPAEIISALRGGSRFTEGQSLTTYMDGFRVRAGEWHGPAHRSIRIDTPDNFVADLIEGGYLTAVAD